MFSTLYNIINNIFYGNNSIKNDTTKIEDIKDCKTEIKSEELKSEEQIFEQNYNSINERKIYFLKNGVIKNQISYIPYKFKENIVELKKIFNIRRFEFIMTIDEEEELEKEREYYINNNVVVIREYNIIKIPENLLDKEDYICAIFYADDSYLL